MTTVEQGARPRALLLERLAPTPSSSKIKKFFVSLAMLPLISCATPQFLNSRNVATSIKGTECHFILRDAGASVAYTIQKINDGRTVEMWFKLDVPEGVDLAKVTLIEKSCQEKRLVAVTDKYIIRTLGYKDRINGKEMLGIMDGKFYPQNAVLFSLAPLGTIVAATVSENMVVVTTGDGRKFQIDADRPSQPARLQDAAKTE